MHTLKLSARKQKQMQSVRAYSLFTGNTLHNNLRNSHEVFALGNGVRNPYELFFPKP